MIISLRGRYSQFQTANFDIVAVLSRASIVVYDRSRASRNADRCVTDDVPVTYFDHLNADKLVAKEDA